MECIFETQQGADPPRGDLDTVDDGDPRTETPVLLRRYVLGSGFEEFGGNDRRCESAAEGVGLLDVGAV